MSTIKFKQQHTALKGLLSKMRLRENTKLSDSCHVNVEYLADEEVSDIKRLSDPLSIHNILLYMWKISRRTQYEI